MRLRQDELEAHLIAAPAANWEEAAGKARYRNRPDVISHMLPFGATPSPLSNYRSPGLDSIQTDLGSV